jgi:TRAP-type C4-dicarboxylate transport system permease small subunit
MEKSEKKSWLKKLFLSLLEVSETASEITFRIAKPICFVLLLAIVIVLLMEIFFRRVQILNVTWSEEVAKMLCVALTIISASVALKTGFHIGTTYILTKIKNFKVIYFLNLIAQLFILAFLFLAVYYGFQYSIGISYQTSPSVGISMFWPHLSIPIGSLMMFVHSSYFLMKNLNGLLAIGDDQF